MGILKVKPVMISGVHGNLCTRKYYNHKKGCPNYGKKEECPPNRKRFEDVFDMKKDVFAIYNIFAFGDHVRKMRLRHPDWSQRQVECCLYWQGKAKKQLREKIINFIKFADIKLNIIMIPEATGVDVTHTMANVGHFLEWPPVSFTYQIALAAQVQRC